MALSYFPQIKRVHTSKIFHGQIYIPMANWLLMIGAVIVTAVYNNTTSLGNAYGVCVILVTFVGLPFNFSFLAKLSKTPGGQMSVLALGKTSDHAFWKLVPVSELQASRLAFLASCG